MRINRLILTGIIFTITFVLHNTGISAAAQNHFNIYLDADMSHAGNSGLAIEYGIRIALKESNNIISGKQIKLLIRDHHGNSYRSLKHLKEYLADPEGLAIFCGLHSPPILSNLSFIQSNGILILDPWAAAGPITRKTDSSGKNWIFRLSVDDTKAGDILVKHTVDINNFRRPALLLEDTGWGKSNEHTLKSALAKRNISPATTIFFDWKLGLNGAREIISDIYERKADVIILVANAPEGITLINALAAHPAENRLPIRSHWGITGGNFFEKLGSDIITKEINLQFLQTSFSFLDQPLSKLQTKVFKQLTLLDPAINKPEDLKAPTGFIHAYDLTKLLIAAAKPIKWKNTIIENRILLQEGMENIKIPVHGLIKTYQKPFCKFTDYNLDAHEALGKNDLRMAEYLTNGGIKLIRNPLKKSENK
ncbi:MAG: ABC transporter substrate-binding protein [Planctomycetota bacterium]|jgi:branched-chain amino acid transport system substrate-binding protein